ncbi:hypothetical protein HG536_0C05920 [Torulaspora globosa]|uniref:Uncharacterized protein n=1 Tax=Torulaspora globosa TaxID=48254 RepID=A0A7G3ZFY7_9SACH|nr:uncharacterized protein HG536_0C05920 [Torulaspora globosa]QLL32423.1 hypothetical protein HG536_0C05920 [Torulaspora globosa]
MNENDASRPSRASEAQDAEVPNLKDLAAQWQTKKFGDQVREKVLKDKVLVRIQEATSVIMDLAARQEGAVGEHFDKMEWDSLYNYSANVMDEYTKNVDSILNQLDQLYRKQYLWQESVFLIDSQTGASVIGKAEEWMKLKEQHLEYKGVQLDRSANVIKSAIERLTSKN